MDASQIVLTAEGRQKLVEELAWREGDYAKEIVEDIKEARAFGDLSENSEYDAAKDKVAAVKIVDDVDDVLLSSQEGIIIRLHANEIPVQSRYGSGVRVMRLGENDKVMVLARTDHDDEAQTETVEAEEGDEPTAEQLAAMEAADEASASEAPSED